MRETSLGTGSAHKIRKGFVDLQVNGYLGIDFSSPTLSREDIHSITTALVQAGTIAFCATLITADLEIYKRNFRLLARTMEEPGVRNHVLGIHLEGPYLSPLDGARGAHSRQWIRKPDPEEFHRLQDWAEGRIMILTLAPEVEGALELISFVTTRYQTRIALGHHLASSEIVCRAADAGASLITHLGNGCPNVLPRHENILIHQLVNDSLTAGIITDGNHIPKDFIRLVFRCKGVDRVFVVSDSAPIAGFEPGIYQTMGNQVRLTNTGRIENLHAPHLVGSGCNMVQCMRHLRSLELLSENELWQVGLDNPLQVLGLSLDSAVLASLPDIQL